MHELHKEISGRSVQSNANYKLQVDVGKIFKTFNVGDFVIVWIRPEQFPSETVKKLHGHSASPFQILKKLNDYVYVLDIPKDFDIVLYSMSKT